MPGRTRLYHVFKSFSPSVYVWEKPEKEKIRTFEVFKCPICGALTNRALYTGFIFKSRYQIKVFCPNSAKCWHHELEDKVGELSRTTPISDKFKLLIKEIKKLLRLHKKGVKSDVVGRPSKSPVCEVTRTRQYRRGCRHNFPPFPGLKVM